ncbi:uncharacterized protein MELLADRAFT_56689 [Melampsora larici-populina 98AG31]|uniref:Uncharacterized protein n=1 Tax=Melampsora larici-populina (strain 98AG31 / pathotype 3-4-7) TaxID=747676 RepID=F4RT49_MELLP|nr:uncharacterized protein MELLADRAFT_56689 [Melampsora larici-populina 98AG31]EGG04441.1 hypothetical protein MELLADRAFT_56689 [Melampsora larici-populina 98AG31]
MVSKLQRFSILFTKARASSNSPGTVMPDLSHSRVEDARSIVLLDKADQSEPQTSAAPEKIRSTEHVVPGQHRKSRAMKERMGKAPA